MKVPDDISRAWGHWNTSENRFDSGGPSGWFFFDSGPGAGYSTIPRFFLVIFRACQTADCESTAGFVEVVDNAVGDLAGFAKQVVQANANLTALFVDLAGRCNMLPPPLGPSPPVVTYHSVPTSKVIAFDCLSILSIDGVAEALPSLASGDVINSQEDGLVTIENHRTGLRLELDLRDIGNMCQRLGPNQPCIE